MIILLLIFLSCAGGSGSLSSSSNRNINSEKTNIKENNKKTSKKLERENIAATKIQAAWRYKKARDAVKSNKNNEASENISEVKVEEEKEKDASKDEIKQRRFVDTKKAEVKDTKVEEEVLIRAIPPVDSTNNNTAKDKSEESDISKVEIIYDGSSEKAILKLVHLSEGTEDEEMEISFTDLKEEVVEYVEKGIDVLYNSMLVRELLVEGNLEERDKIKIVLMDWSEKDTELKEFVTNGEIEDIKLMIELGIYEDREILYQIFERAHKEGRQKEFSQLALLGIKKGISIKEIFKNSSTALIVSACHKEYIDLFKAILNKEGSKDILYKKDKSELTVLYYIILHLNMDALEILLEEDRNIDMSKLDFESNDEVKIRPMSLFTTSFIINKTKEDIEKASTMAKLLAGKGFVFDYISDVLRDKLKLMLPS